MKHLYFFLALFAMSQPLLADVTIEIDTDTLVTDLANQQMSLSLTASGEAALKFITLVISDEDSILAGVSNLQVNGSHANAFPVATGGVQFMEYVDNSIIIVLNAGFFGAGVPGSGSVSPLVTFDIDVADVTPGPANFSFTTTTGTIPNASDSNLVSTAGIPGPIAGALSFPSATIEVVSYGIATDADGTLETSEGETSATFDVTLNTEPTSDVVVSVSSSVETEGTVSPSTLTFTAGTWDDPQTVTVTGQDDDVDDGDQDYQVQFVLDSLDTNYDSDSNPAPRADAVAMRNLDDDTAGIALSPTGQTSEALGQATIGVVLESQPTANVVVTATSLDTSEGTVTANSILTFTPGDWDSQRFITVTGANDDVDDGLVSYTINLDVASDDTLYAVLDTTQDLSNSDDDQTGVDLNVTDALTAEASAGNTGTASVVLLSEPVSDVVYTFASNDASEGAVSGGQTLTFTSANWNETQTVTVTGANDDVDDGDVGYTLNVNTSTGDPTYSGFSFPTVGFTNLDDDDVGIVVTPLTVSLEETSDTQTITVRLNSEPTGNVTLLVSSGNTNDLTVSESSLEFTPDDWDEAQEVLLTTVDDSASRDDSTQVTVSPNTAATVDPAYDTVSDAVVQVTINDDDTPKVLIASSDLETSEDGSTIHLDVTLQTQPLSDVTVDFTTADASEGTVSISATVTFTSENWDEAVTVTVAGADDAVQDGNISYDITYTLTTTDPGYAALDDAGALTAVSLTNLDDEAVRFEMAGPPQRAASITADSTLVVEVSAFDTNDRIASYTGSHNLIFGGASASPNGTEPTVEGTVFGQSTAVTFTSGKATVSVHLRNVDQSTITVVDADDNSIAQGTLDTVVTAGAAAQLSFSEEPESDPDIPGSPGTVEVSVLDLYGNLNDQAAHSISLSLVEAGTSTGAAGLTGGGAQSASSGVVTFSSLQVASGGVYDLVASASGLTDGTSASFSIGDPPPDLTAITPNDGGTTPLAQTIEEGVGVQATFTASFFDGDRSGQPVGEGQVSSVVWEVRRNASLVETITDTTTGTPDSYTSTFNFDIGLDRVSSGDGTHPNEATFEITATGNDQNAGTTTQAWQVTVQDNNTAPVLQSVGIAVQGGGSAFIDSIFEATPGTATDADNDTTTFTYEWLVNNSVVGGETSTTFSNGGSSHFTKGDSVSVRVTPVNATRDDDANGSAVTSASVPVQNSAPIVAGQSPTIADNGTLNLDLSTGSDDADDDALTFTVVQAPTQGSVSQSNAALDYTADWPELASGSEGMDQIVFRANDGSANSDTGVISITVTGVNDAPVAQPINVSVRANVADDSETYTVEFTASATDIDDNDSSLTFRLLSVPSANGVPSGTLETGSPGRAGLGVNGTVPVTETLVYTPEDDFRGLIEFTFEILDDENATSGSISGKITVGTPPWFLFIDLTEIDGGLDPENPEGFYQIVIEDAGGDTVLNTSLANKTAVEPIDYLNAGNGGLLPGTYFLTVSKFNGAAFVAIASDLELVVDDYELPTAEIAVDVDNPEQVNGNQVFYFDLEIAAGYTFELEQPDGSDLWFEETFRPDNDGVIPLNGRFSRSLFLSQSGLYTLTVIASNPKGESSAATAQFNLASPAGPTARPGIVDNTSMVPGTDDIDAPQNAATASAADDDLASVAFSWGAVDGASGYSIYLSTYGREIVENVTRVESGSTTFGPILLPPGNYFWHIIAENAEGLADGWSDAAYFTVERDPTSQQPFIEELDEVVVTETGVTFSSDSVRNATHVDLFVYQRTNSSNSFPADLRNRLADFIEVTSDSFSFDLNDPLLNQPNETYVFQIRPVRLNNKGNLDEVGPWLRADSYLGHDDGTAGGVATPAQILANLPGFIHLDLDNAQTLEFQFRVFRPETLSFVPDDALANNVRTIANDTQFTVDPSLVLVGTHTHIRVRAVTASGPAAWSSWAIRVNELND